MSLFLACFALYSQTLHLGFFSLDDPDYVQNNPWIEGLNHAKLAHILSRAYFANYAPGHLLTYALDVALAGGKSATAMHVSNVLWYGFVVCAVYLLAFSIYPSIPVAASAALLFTVHPAHVEVVAWISSRKDLVATAFAILSMVCYLQYTSVTHLHSYTATQVRGGRGPVDKSKRSAFVWYACALVTFLLASSAKQSVVLLPVVMLAWDFASSKKLGSGTLRNWRILVDKIPFAIITVLFGWMTWGAQPSTKQSPEPFVLAVTQWSSLWLMTGFGKYVLYRPRPDPAQFAVVTRILIIGGALLTWAVPLLLARRRKFIRGWLSAWVLLQMLPPMALSFLTPVTDRYLFLSSVGFCVLVVGCALRRCAVLDERNDLMSSSPLKEEREKRQSPDSGTAAKERKEHKEKALILESLRSLGSLRLLNVLVVLLASLWSWKTLAYLSEWADPRSVWYFAARKAPSPEAFQYSGEVYHEAATRLGEFLKSGKYPTWTNDLPLAQVLLNDSTRLSYLSSEWSGASASRTNSIAYREQLWSLAWDAYSQAVTHRGTLNTPNLFMRRGMLLIDRGKAQDAIKEFQNGLTLAQVHTYEKVRWESGTHLQRAIGVAYWNLHKYPEAKEWLLKAQATQRESGEVWVPTLPQEIEKVTALAGR